MGRWRGQSQRKELGVLGLWMPFKAIGPDETERTLAEVSISSHQDKEEPGGVKTSSRSGGKKTRRECSHGN